MGLKPNEFRTACRGCHGGCIHILTVEDGKVVKVRPDPDAPLNMGHACEKGMSIIEQMYHPDRLTYPMRRVGERGSGQWERISWDEALDSIACKLTQLKNDHGPECISAITGTGRHHIPYLWRFTKALGTPNITSAGAMICLGPRKNAGFSTSGTYSCVDYYGEVLPQCIVVWGANPTVSGADGELQWHPKRCAQQGTKFIVVDPLETELAAHADLWLRLRPGTDGALAIGILNVIIQEDLYDHEFVDNWTFGFEELKKRCTEYDLDRVSEITWVPKEQIVKAAHMMAEVKPMSLEWGCAFEQSYNSTQTCRAIYMIPALVGSFDVPGGFVESKKIVQLKRDPMEPSTKLINYYPHKALKPYAHPHQVLDSIRTGYPTKIRAMMSFANNSLISLPDSRRVYECLSEIEFFVCMDFFMTPTAELADIVLPAALWPELDAVFCMPEFSEHMILCQQKLVQVGECRSDEEVFIELCKRMGLDYGADSQKELLDKEISEMAVRYPELEGVKFDDLKKNAYYVPERKYYNYKLRGGFPTPTGKYEFYSKEIESLGGDPLPCWYEPPVTPVSRPDLRREFPYVLTTGGRRMQYFISNNRQIRSLRRQYPFPLVRMHPDTAVANGIKEGDWVYIRTFQGRITQKAKLEPSLDPRVINCDFGWWYPEAGAQGYGWTESNVNMLTSCDNGCDSYMGSYQLRSLLCNIYKNENCRIEERYYNSPLYLEPSVDDSSDSIVIDSKKCMLCGECVRTCARAQSISAIELCTVDGITQIRAKGGSLRDGSCVGCGQCHASCPTGALRIKNDLDRVKEALADPNTVVLAQIAPSVRVGLGGYLGFEKGENSLSYLVGALKKLGFDKVYDTLFGADLTVIEEGEEFLAHLEKGEKLPLFTSCCPAWVKFCEENYPEFRDNISTCRSPQQMLGAVIKNWHRLPGNSSTKKQVLVSIMPCTAKKAEILRSESRTAGQQDVDLSITTSELLELLSEAGINMENCEKAECDAPFSYGSGAAAIFGSTGGVTEAVLRYLAGKLGDLQVSWSDDAGVKRCVISLGETELKLAVVSGLANARAVLERLKTGEEQLHLLEVMACPGGCVMGGGQPSDEYVKLQNRAQRSSGLYKTDERSAVKTSQFNEAVREVWTRVISGHEHELLHRNFNQ